MVTLEKVRTRLAELESNFQSWEFDQPAPTLDPCTWLAIGDRRNFVESNYCDAKLLREILILKSVLDDRDVQDIRTARYRSNFFEVKPIQFMTRTAVKIADLDAMFGWSLCQPLDKVKESEKVMYFVDVFGGPGGCSEYVLWRNAGGAKGFGFTTRGDYEFQLERFRAAAGEALDPFYGRNDSGNIFDPENIARFMEYVKMQTDRRGVHLVMCDGGFYVKNVAQEHLSKRLYLCLAIMAVNVVRPGGNAILKVFDLYTDFSIGLVYILCKTFKKVSIVKPALSRPANSERYLICEGRLNGDPSLGEYLLFVNKILWENKLSGIDVVGIVSGDIIQADEQFLNFIRKSNNELARRQIVGLSTLIDAMDKSYRTEYFERQKLQSILWRIWKLDHDLGVAGEDNELQSGADYVNQFLDSTLVEKFARSSCSQLSKKKSLEKSFKTPQDWYFVPVDVTANQGKTIRTLFVSKGNGKVFYFDRNFAGSRPWHKLEDYHLLLPPKTVLYGEIAEEIIFKDGNQKITLALHIIDGIMLDGRDIRHLSLAKRFKCCKKFAKIFNRPLADWNITAVQPIPVRCKQMFPMVNLDTFLDNTMAVNKLHGGYKVLSIDIESLDPDETKRFYIPRGLLFLRHSVTAADGRKRTELVDFAKTISSGTLWTWAKTSQLCPSHQCCESSADSNLVYRAEFDAFIRWGSQKTD